MKKSRIFLRGKTILIGLTISVAITFVLVYLTGASSHRTILDNSLISISVIAALFILFISTGLYMGLHVVDNLSHKLKVNWGSSKSKLIGDSVDLPDSSVTIETDDGISGIILTLLIWILMSVMFVAFVFLFEAIVWAGIAWIVILIYWLLMRALKLVFAYSGDCKGNLIRSVLISLKYTAIYVGWIFGLIYIASHLAK